MQVWQKTCPQSVAVGSTGGLSQTRHVQGELFKPDAAMVGAAGAGTRAPVAMGVDKDGGRTV